MRTLAIALLAACAARTVHADVVWRRDWEGRSHDTIIDDTVLDGGPVSVVDVGTQDVTVVSGPVRTWDAAGVGGYDLIAPSGSGLFEVLVEITSVQYASNALHTLDFVIGTGSSNNRTGAWFLEFGTVNGGVFDILPAVDAGSATYGFHGTLGASENFNDDVNPSELFGYNVGGRSQQLMVDAADAVNGRNMALRFGITSSSSFAGFSDMALSVRHADIPEIQSFTAGETAAWSNDTVILSWVTVHADSLRLEPGVGDVTGSTSTAVVVAGDTTYALIASNAFGSVTGTVDILVYPPRCAGDLPNILFICSEDNGPELGCYGDPYASTPALDQLAADGVRFQNASVTYSVCSPSRASFYTGLHIAQNGHLGLATHKFAMYEPYPTFYQLLQERGYRTGLIGKLHINPAGAVDAYVDYRAITGSNFGQSGRNMRTYAEKANAFIAGAYSGADTSRPFLLTINYPDAHLPMWDTAPTDDPSDPDTLPKHPLNWMDVQTIPWVGVTSQRLREQTAGYYNSLRRLDDGIAMVLEGLDDAGYGANTLVIYIGDHGAQFSRGKTSVYEAGMRIPMIVRWPGEAVPGLVREELVSILDIMPTMLKAAGVTVPPAATGRPLQPLLAGREVAWRKYVYGISTGSAPSIGYLQFSVRDARYKLISNPLRDPAMPSSLFNLHNRSAQAYLDGNGHFAAGCTPAEVATAPAHVQAAYDRFLDPPRWELYDLATDPEEWTNLADSASHADVKQRLIGALEAWQENEIIQDPLAAFSNQVLYAQAQEDAIGTNYRSDPYFRWNYLDSFPAWREEAYPDLFPSSVSTTGALYQTGFEAPDGFDFVTGTFAPFTVAVTDVWDAVWTGDGGSSGIGKRSDLPPEGEQLLRVGAGSGVSTATVVLPAAITKVSSIQFSYANYSSATDTDGTVDIRQAGTGAWTDLWTRHFTGLEVDWRIKPWPVATVPVDITGPVEVRFRSEGVQGVMFDKFALLAFTPVPTNQVSFAAWQSNHFTVAELSAPEVSGFRANPDDDGLVNGLEYRMGHPPKTWNEWLIDGPEVEDGFVTATYQESLIAEGTVALQDALDLGGWQDWHTRVNYPADPRQNRRVKAIRLPQHRDDRMFFRAGGSAGP
jgi:N-sulfoglucosamine sulfohydrolase